MSKQLKITLVTSPIACLKDQQATVKALGLRKLHQSVVREDTPSTRGMIFKVRHLVRVEEMEGAAEEAKG